MARPKTANKKRQEVETIYERKTDKPNIGRPKKYRTCRMNLRLTEKEDAMLEECTEMTGKTRTEIIVEAIALLHKALHPETRDQ